MRHLWAFPFAVVGAVKLALAGIREWRRVDKAVDLDDGMTYAAYTDRHANPTEIVPAKPDEDVPLPVQPPTERPASRCVHCGDPVPAGGMYCRDCRPVYVDAPKGYRPLDPPVVPFFARRFR